MSGIVGLLQIQSGIPRGIEMPGAVVISRSDKVTVSIVTS